MDNRRSFLAQIASAFALLWNAARDTALWPTPSLDREIDARFTMLRMAPGELGGRWAYSINGTHWKPIGHDVPTMFGRTLLRCESYDPIRDRVRLAQFHCVDGVPVSVGRSAVERGYVRLGYREIAQQMRTREWMRTR